MTKNTILVGTDLTITSDVAVQQALTISRKIGAELVVANVGSARGGSTGAAPHDSAMAMNPTTIGTERATCEPINRHANIDGTAISHLIVEGVPDKALCDAATRLNAALIVVGTHDRPSILRMLYGSVSAGVVHNSDVDVLVARSTQHVPGEYRRVLVATDFSASANNALASALRLAADDAKIDILHCWELLPHHYYYFTPPRSMGDILGEERNAVRKEIEDAGKELVAAYERPGVTLRFNSIESPPIEGVLDWLAHGDYDLVVTGTHGRRGFQRVVLGSVAEAVSRRAHCSALVVHSGCHQHNHAPHTKAA